MTKKNVSLPKWDESFDSNKVKCVLVLIKCIFDSNKVKIYHKKSGN